MDLYKRDQGGPEVNQASAGAASGAPSQQQQANNKPVRSLLSRARNSTINLASLANVTQRFHCSASVGNLWPPAEQQQPVNQPVQQKQNQEHQQQQTSAPGQLESPSRKTVTKEKRKRQKEAERIEKLKMLVNYLRSGSSQQLLNPVRLEADELELAQRYKQSQIMCEDCLQAAEQRQQQLHQNQQSQAGSAGSRTPDSQAPCCSSSGCCNSAQLAAASSSSSTGANPTKMFYIEELERGAERKASDTSDTTANSQQLIVIRTNQNQSQNLSTSNEAVMSSGHKHAACQCCSTSHLRSMLSISTSEAAGIVRDLPTRSWSTELFLSSTPTSAVKKLVAASTSPSYLVAGQTGATPAILSASQVDVTMTPASSLCQEGAETCTFLATKQSDTGLSGAQATGKQHQPSQLNMTTTTSSSNTSGVGQSSGSLPTVASAASFNLSIGPAVSSGNNQLFHHHIHHSDHIQHQQSAQATHTHSNHHLQLIHNSHQHATNLDYQSHDNDCEESCCCGSSTTSSSSHTNNLINNLPSGSSSNSNIVINHTNINSIDNIGSQVATATMLPYDARLAQEQQPPAVSVTNGVTSSSPALSTSPSQQKTSTWTNPQTLATWIDNEVNSLVSDLEAKSQLIESKASKRSKRRWLSSGDNSRRNSSGSHST